MAKTGPIFLKPKSKIRHNVLPLRTTFAKNTTELLECAWMTCHIQNKITTKHVNATIESPEFSPRTQTTNRGKILIIAEAIRLLAKDIKKKPELRYGHLCGFLEAKMVILGPIDFNFVCKLILR